ncbi:MAG: glycosyltransferase [Bacteroidota bacterium]|nr:glycosyltransferase [Bacteroidota bacterium]
MIKVLFISQWYPHRYDPMLGLFVQKHAEAVSLYCKVKVLYVHADENIRTFEMEEKVHFNMSELIVYYPYLGKNILYKVAKPINYIRAYWIGYKHISQQGFTPDIVHANILTRTAFIAYLLKLWKGIPYIISEHWSRYLLNRNTFNGTLRKILTRLVVRNAKAILPVSESLKEAMLTHKLTNENYIVIYNVVDNFFFHENPIIVHHLKKRIINVSCFDEQAKNIKGIIRACHELSKLRQDFEVILIGTGADFEDVKEYSDSLNFPTGIINFLGEKTSKEVANWMHNSDFFVLFSNFETAGVVISESLACGKPVLCTRVGIAPECINDKNGILISTNDENELLKKMNYLLDHFQDYDSTMIKKESMDKFNYSHIGAKITKIYENSIL